MKKLTKRKVSSSRLFNAIKRKHLRRKVIPAYTNMEVFKGILTPAIIYASGSCLTTDRHKSRTLSLEIRFLRKIEEKTRRHKIGNVEIGEELQVKYIEREI